MCVNNIANKKMQSSVHQGRGRLYATGPLVLLLDTAWRVRMHAAAGMGRELSLCPSEVLLAVEGMWGAEILVLLSLFRNNSRKGNFA